MALKILEIAGVRLPNTHGRPAMTLMKTYELNKTARKSKCPLGSMGALCSDLPWPQICAFIFLRYELQIRNVGLSNTL